MVAPILLPRPLPKSRIAGRVAFTQEPELRDADSRGVFSGRLSPRGPGVVTAVGSIVVHVSGPARVADGVGPLGAPDARPANPLDEGRAHGG